MMVLFSFAMVHIPFTQERHLEVVRPFGITLLARRHHYVRICDDDYGDVTDMRVTVNGMCSSGTISRELRKSLEDGMNGDEIENMPYEDCLACYRFLRKDCREEKDAKRFFKVVCSNVDSVIKNDIKHRTPRWLSAIGWLMTAVGLLFLVFFCIQNGPPRFGGSIADIVLWLDRFCTGMVVWFLESGGEFELGKYLFLLGLAVISGTRLYNLIRLNQVRIRLVVMICSHWPEYREIGRIARFGFKNGSREALYYYDVKSRHSGEWSP